MSVQYRDGSFGETKAIQEAMEEFETAIDAGTAKALHIGTPEEIEELKAQVDMADRIEAMEGRLRDIEAMNSSIIETPTHEQLKKILDTHNEV
ncbi:MAG: hypothetical protein ABW134_11890 [Candidatus Thiodiazotropha endolucinida]